MMNVASFYHKLFDVCKVSLQKLNTFSFSFWLFSFGVTICLLSVLLCHNSSFLLEMLKVEKQHIPHASFK